MNSVLYESKKLFLDVTCFYGILSALNIEQFLSRNARMLTTQNKETFDFTGLSREEVKSLLQKYNLVLTVDEALTIQNTILKRPPTLAELVLWSIQGSEHCSYKSSRKHLKI